MSIRSASNGRMVRHHCLSDSLLKMKLSAVDAAEGGVDEVATGESSFRVDAATKIAATAQTNATALITAATKANPDRRRGGGAPTGLVG